MINEAIEWMSCHVPVEKWMFVDVAIAPSTITISEHTVRFFPCVSIIVCCRSLLCSAYRHHVLGVDKMLH